MLSTSLLASFFLVATSVQAAPFISSSKALYKRAEPQTADSINKQVHTNSTQVEIHESCDAGQAHFIRAGLDDMNMLAKHAYDRILKYGETDELYVKYFGNASSATAAGFYAQLLYGNKPGVLFRCDNPDGNCNESTAEGPWGENRSSLLSTTLALTDDAFTLIAGHHRGKNATEQTVICPPTYTRRKQLSTLCWDGVAIGSEPPSRLLATDFMHRLIHVPSITYDHIHHAADSLGGVLELAARNDPTTVANQNTYLFYSLDTYAYDVVWPGKSCMLENPPNEDADGHDSHSAPASASATSAPTATATSTHDHDHDHAAEPTASATAAAAESCHTHSDGEVHCS
ncbi:hypothetical protein C6P46_000652 [Rhodotorula mucilaginosa]|uniref:Putative peptidase domain-containing protein n=1 Tax=Rhodotorula mucilaginosa TaxID=5537 RepID=A0A9P6W7K7_RHOMI|nr:hypothetical protein C6P46_000652 [Rhodotorula mucilaginosa]